MKGVRKMVGILVATHGEFSKGLLNAVELIAGKQEKIKTIGLFHGDGIGEFEEKVNTLIDELDEGNGVLAFVDLLGGSPCNVVMRAMAKHDKLRAIAGVNMPMLVTAATMQEGAASVEELYTACLEAGQEGIVSLYEEYLEMLANAENAADEDF